MEVVETLRKEDLLDCLVLQHSHLGSQVPNMVEIRKFAQEASRLLEIAWSNLRFLLEPFLGQFSINSQKIPIPSLVVRFVRASKRRVFSGWT